MDKLHCILFALFSLSLTAELHGLVISEIHYRPPEGEHLEFVEVSNDAPSPEDISGYSFVEGIVFTFPPGTVLEAGGVLVVCANVDAVRAVYGIENAVGNFVGRLDNGGERLTIANHAGRVIQSLRYNDQGKWPVGPDGTGHTLVLKRVHLDASEPENWTSSPELGGSPGQRNFPEPAEPVYEETVVVDTGEEWRYRKGTAPFSDPPLDWTTEDFDDSDWLLGPSSFGFGYPDQATELDDMLVDTQTNYTTLALRKRIVLTDQEIDGPGQLRLGIRYDDGFCAFINGTEFASSFCRVVEWDAVIRDLHEALTEEFFHIDAALLKPGENVLAVFGVNRIDFNFRLEPRVTHRVRVYEDEIVEFRGDFNELFRGDGSGDSWVELFNAGDTTLDLGGLLVTEDPARVDSYVIPDGTTLGPKEFLVLRESETSLRLSTETVQLFLLDRVDRVVSAAAFDRVISPAIPPDAYSEARYPDGADSLWVTDEPTPGAPNVVTRVTDIVINEIFYHPPEDRAGEFIELYHRGAGGVIDLSGFRFDRGISYTFPEGSSLAPGEYLVLSEDPELLRNHYGLGGVHRYEGVLANGGENIRLVDRLGNLVDEVRYWDGGRWSSWADGRGASLELIDPAQDNDFASAWDASDESDKAAWERLSYAVPRYKRGPAESELHIFLAKRGICHIDDVSITRPALDGSSILDIGAEWRYRKGTAAFSDPPLAWIDREFDDNEWLVGATPIGVRFLGLNTRLGDMRGNYTSVAARKTFLMTQELLDSPEEIFFGITFDDGFCAYLNGVELARENCPDDVTWDATATAERFGEEEVLAIPKELLMVGENLLAVVVFNRGIANNDFLLSPRVALRAGNGPNVIPNPGFETDTASWSIDGTHIDSHRTTDDSQSGDACLRLIAAGKGDNVCNRIETDTSPSLFETGYDVSLWTRWQRGSSLLILHGTFAPGPPEWRTTFDFPTRNLATNSLGARLRMTVPRNLGTPGEENSVRARLRAETGSDNLGPVIAEVRHLPFSPDAEEPVHVIARVADADGVAAVRVVFTDDIKSGEFEESSLFDDGAHDDGDPGDGVYGGQIPGFSASKRIVFFVEAEDTEQAVRAFPRNAPEKTLVYMVEGPVPETVQIVMDDRSREALALRPLFSNRLLDGTLMYRNDDVYYNVELRYRGSPWARGVRNSYRVRFPKDQRFHRGRKEINFSNRDIFDGIWSVLIARNSTHATPAPAFDYHYVTARFDGESMGAPMMWETMGRDFLEKWYGQEAGEEFVCLKAKGRTQYDQCNFLGWDGASSRHMDGSSESYRFYWNHAIHQIRDNWEPWIRFTEVMDPLHTSDEDFDRRVFDVVDVEGFLRVLGPRITMRAGDALFVSGGHNGYAVWIPERGWGLSPIDMGANPSPFSSLTDLTEVSDIGVARMLQSAPVRRMHYRLLLEYANGYWSDLVWPFLDALEEDPNAPGDASFKGRIAGSSASIKQRLAPLADIEFLITTNSGMDFETEDISVELQGQAGIEVATLVFTINDSESRPLDVRWDPELVTEWIGAVDLDAKTNVIEVFGFDSEGNVLDTAQIVVVTSGSPIPPFIRGDVREDGRINISDAIAVLLHLFRGESLRCRDAADVNDDGLIQIDDVLAILEYVFLGGQQPEAPFPTAGRDTTEDDLGCEG
jgi:hypothetical protein